MSYLVFDIETVPSEDMPEELKPDCPLGNLKDKDKIALKVQEWEEHGQVKKMSVSPFMSQIVSIQMYSGISGQYCDAGTYDEVEMLRYLDHEMSCHDVVVGHNIMGFDLQVVIARAMFLGIKLEICSRLIKKYSNYPFYDTMQVLAGWDSSRWKGLDWWCKRLGIKGKSGDGGKVYQMWKEGKREEIDEYCREDVMANVTVYERIKDYYK